MAYDYETIPLLGDDDEETEALAGTFTLPAERARAWARGGIDPIARPRNFGYVASELLADRITVAPDLYIVASDRATTAGVVAATAPDGTPLVGAYGELRESAGDRAIVASYLADPSTI
jgi:hypothetical protein